MTRDTLELDDRDAREREWTDTTGNRYRWIADAGWFEWAGSGWDFAGWLVHLTGPFTAVHPGDEIGIDDDYGWVIDA